MASSKIFSSPIFPYAFGGVTFFMCYQSFKIFRRDFALRAQDYYHKPLSMLENYKPAEQFLGSPILGGRVDFTDKEKYFVEDSSARLSIPVKGPKDKGILHVSASRDDSENSRWVVDQLDLEIVSSKMRWTFYDKKLVDASIDKAKKLLLL